MTVVVAIGCQLRLGLNARSSETRSSLFGIFVSCPPFTTLSYTPSLSFPLYTTMPTELPYAADAEVSLSFDEIEVRREGSTQGRIPELTAEGNDLLLGLASTISERNRTIPRHSPDKVQLRLGTC